MGDKFTSPLCNPHTSLWALPQLPAVCLPPWPRKRFGWHPPPAWPKCQCHFTRSVGHECDQAVSSGCKGLELKEVHPIGCFPFITLMLAGGIEHSGATPNLHHTAQGV